MGRRPSIGAVRRSQQAGSATAAPDGQGIVAEVLNLSQLPGYETGGTVHVIVNNQIGFTTLPAEARSTMYCTDVAKMIEAPIFHVNGDDPIAVEFVAKIALEFRQNFSRDVVADLYCYRRYGHNETDEPSFTQPRLYKRIHAHSPVTKLFKDRMLQSGVLTGQEAENLEKEFRRRLENALTEVETSEVKSKKDFHRGLEESTAIFQPPYSHREPETRIAKEMIDLIVDRITRVPEGFRVQPQIKKSFLDQQRTTRPNQPARRVLHFSDGSLEEYSEDENEKSNECTAVKEKYG